MLSTMQPFLDMPQTQLCCILDVRFMSGSWWVLFVKIVLWMIQDMCVHYQWKSAYGYLGMNEILDAPPFLLCMGCCVYPVYVCPKFIPSRFLKKYGITLEFQHQPKLPIFKSMYQLRLHNFNHGWWKVSTLLGKFIIENTTVSIIVV